MQGRTGAVTALAFPPFGRSLAAVGADGILGLWDRDSGALRWSVPVRSPVTDLAFHANGQILVSAGRDGAIRLWNPRDGSLLRTLEGHQEAVSAVALSGIDALASTGADGRIRFWNPQTGEARLIATPLPNGQWLSWNPTTLYYNASPDGDQAAALAFGDDTPLYPLYYYRSQLLRPELLNGLSELEPPPTPPLIEPKPLRLRWDRIPNKKLWFGIGPALVLLLMAGLVLLRRRADRLAFLRRFFKSAGFERIKSYPNCLLVSRGGSGTPRINALALMCSNPRPILDKLPNTIPASAYERLYMVYPDQAGPQVSDLQDLRQRLQKEIIPLPEGLLRQALRNDTCDIFLEERDAPYFLHGDPYANLQIITDPLWFHGRRALTEALSRQLVGGEHVGLFGLPQVGKSSLLHQLKLRLLDHPVVLIRGYGLAACADPYFLEILNQFRNHLSAMGCKRLPKIPLETNVEHFRGLFLSLYRRWRKRGGKGSVVILMDGIDRLLPSDNMPGHASVLAEYSQLFRPLRDLATDEKRLALLICAQRPDANQRREMGSLAQENPLLNLLHEVHLGPLEAGESAALLRELGAWKGINWDDAAVDRVFHYCGGHPLPTRLLASAACRRGTVTRVDSSLVDAAAEGSLRDAENDLSGYFHLGLWKSLEIGERHILERVRRAGQAGLVRTAVDEASRADVDSLLRFGLVTDNGGRLTPRAALFWAWLDRHLATQPTL